MVTQNTLRNLLSSLYVHIALIVGAVLFSYWGLWNTYFQQDEWSGFGKALYAAKHGFLASFKVTGFHFVPFTSFFVNNIFYAFKLHYAYYALYAIVFHIFNSILLYVFVFRMSREKQLALLVGILFAVLYVPSQAVSWYAAAFSVLPSTFFALLSMIVTTYMTKRQGLRLTVLSAVLLFVALGFKEDVLPIGVILILLHIFIPTVSLYKRIGIVALVSTIYLSIRLPIYYFLGRDIMEKFSGGTSNSSVMTNIWYFPLVMSSELSLPGVLRGRVSDFANMLLIGAGSTVAAALEFGSKVYRLIFAFLSLQVFLISKKNKLQQPLKQLLILCLAYMIIGHLPLVVLPGGLLPESRHYYLYSIFVALAFAIVIFYISRTTKNILIRIVSYGVFIFVVMLNTSLVRMSIGGFIKESAVRIEFMDQISRLYPTLPDRAIVFNDGHRPFFQSGLGRTLMVQFHINGANTYHDLFDESFLYGYYDQEYKEKDGKGFGYYFEFEKLKAAFDQQSVPITHVYAFMWDDKAHVLHDVSGKIRAELTAK